MDVSAIMDIVNTERRSLATSVSRSNSPVSLSGSIHSHDSLSFSRCHSPLSRVDVPQHMLHPMVAELRGQASTRRARPHSDGAIWSVYINDVDFSPRRSITDHSCLKVYHKDPAHVFNHGPRPSNGDARVSANLVWMYLYYYYSAFCVYLVIV